MLWVVILVEVQCLYGKVQPPRYIYVGGDDRLKLSKQSTINTNPTFYPLIPCSCFRCSATSREFDEYRQSSWERSNPNQLSQLSPASSDGVPPEVLGHLVRKEPACCPAYRSADPVSRGASCGVSPPTPRVHEDVFVWRLFIATRWCMMNEKKIVAYH